MRLGFTGPREGMTCGQKEMLRAVLATITFVEEAHHGDCIGSDEQFHGIIREMCPETKIVVHPPAIGDYRASCKGDVIMPPKPYLERDRDVVNSSSMLIGCPRTEKPTPHSGTWYTIGFATRAGLPVLVIMPDGTAMQDAHFHA